LVRLYVNVDHVATLRQQRGTRYPDPVAAATLCELAGADGITVHLREDRRHIQDRDVRVLRETVRGVLNLEMAATDEMLRIAREVKPDFCTLVPEKREEQTTEGGLTVAPGGTLEKVVRGLMDAGVGVSLFIDPEPRTIEASARMGAGTVERLLQRAAARAGGRAPAAAPGARSARRGRCGTAPRGGARSRLQQCRPGRGAGRSGGAEHRARADRARGDDRHARRRRRAA
jgi:hypothetical protein